MYCRLIIDSIWITVCRRRDSAPQGVKIWENLKYSISNMKYSILTKNQSEVYIIKFMCHDCLLFKVKTMNLTPTSPPGVLTSTYDSSDQRTV